MPRETDDCGDMTRAAGDRWSPGLAMAFPVVGLVFVSSLAMKGSASLLLFPIILVVIPISISVILYYFVKNSVKLHLRCVVSCYFGLVLGGLIVWSAPNIIRLIIRWEDDRQFARQRPSFDEMVDRERNLPAGRGLLKLVIKSEDRTVFSLSSSFYYIIYDETDEAMHDSGSVRGFWRCPSSETGVFNVGWPKDIEHIDGHYYRYWTTS